MVSHHPAKFVGHRHCGGGDMMILVRHYCLYLKHMACHALLSHTKIQDVDTIINRRTQSRIPDLGYTCLQEQPTEIT